MIKKESTLALLDYANLDPSSNYSWWKQETEYSLHALSALISDKEKILSGTETPAYGLCATAGLYSIEDWMDAVTPEWDKFSGDSGYPVLVQECDEYTTAKLQYYSLPRYQGAYGELRFELAEFLLARLEEDCEIVKKELGM